MVRLTQYHVAYVIATVGLSLVSTSEYLWDGQQNRLPPYPPPHLSAPASLDRKPLSILCSPPPKMEPSQVCSTLPPLLRRKLSDVRRTRRSAQGRERIGYTKERSSQHCSLPDTNLTRPSHPRPSPSSTQCLASSSTSTPPWRPNISRAQPRRPS
jgi:hypothetical protein